jgi:hypothetical protein
MVQIGATLHTHGATKTRIKPDVQTRRAPRLLSCLQSSRHIDRLNLKQKSITVFVHADKQNQITCAFPSGI